MKTKQLFIYSFAFTIVMRTISLCKFRQYIPYTETYLLFMAFWGILAIRESRLIIKLHNKVYIAIAFLAIYDIFFAFSNISVLDKSDVFVNMARSLMMVFFVCISSFWIIKFNCLDKLIYTTYVFFSIFMTILFFIYIPNANLGETISTFWNQFGSMRHRELFGFIANNVAAEHAFSVILLSLYVYHEKCQSKKLTIKKAVIVFDDLLMTVLIIANNSRGTLVTALLMIIVYGFIRYARKNGMKKFIRLAALSISIVVLSVAYYIHVTGTDFVTLFYFTNRMHFIANLQILEKSGRWLLGLGRTTGAFLANQNVLYGLRTDYMEIFYVGVFIQTGIVGLTWIMYTLFILGKGIVKKYQEDKTYMGKWIFTVFVYSLTLSLFEDYVLSSLYITSVFFLCFMVSYCSSKAERLSFNNHSRILGGQY